MKEPLPAQQADSIVKVRDNRRDIAPVLRGQGSNPDFLVQSQVWFQFHHLAMTALAAQLWSGREGSNLQPPAPEAGALPLRHVQAITSVLTVGFEPTLAAV